MDRNLLVLLEYDTHEPTASCTFRRGVPRTKIKERTVRLEREGVMRDYSAIIRQDIDRQALRATVMISFQRAGVLRLAHSLRQFIQVSKCLPITGRMI